MLLAGTNANWRADYVKITAMLFRRLAFIIVFALCAAAGVGAEEKSPLFMAVEAGNAAEIERLIASGEADANKADKRGFTPLHVAADLDNSDAVSALIKNGADTEIVNNSGLTPLLQAVMNGSFWAMNTILKGGGNVNYAQEGSLRTALHFAAVADGYAGTVNDLVYYGAEVNRVDKDGNTPLHLAAQYGSSDAAVALINKGADLNIRNSSGRTPLQVAIHHRGKKDAMSIFLYNVPNFLEKRSEQEAMDLLRKLE